jgi:hypothetical protein
MTTELKIELQQIINEKIVDSLKDIICINVLHSPCGSIMYIDKCNNNIADENTLFHHETYTKSIMTDTYCIQLNFDNYNPNVDLTSTLTSLIESNILLAQNKVVEKIKDLCKENSSIFSEGVLNLYAKMHLKPKNDNNVDVAILKKDDENSLNNLICMLHDLNHKAYYENNLGPFDNIITTKSIAYILAKHKSFELKKDENKIGSIYKLGNILKSINIFIDETMEESSIYFFRKSKTSEPGLQIGIYKNGTNIAEVCNPFSYSNTIVSQLRFAIYDIGSSPEKSFKRITVNLQ